MLYGTEQKCESFAWNRRAGLDGFPFAQRCEGRSYGLIYWQRKGLSPPPPVPELRHQATTPTVPFLEATKLPLTLGLSASPLALSSSASKTGKYSLSSEASSV